MRKVTIKTVSPTQKVMLESNSFCNFEKASCFKNERFSFQIAFRAEIQEKINLKFKIKGDKSALDLRLVGNVPAEFPVYQEKHDEDYISVKPGLFPDVLYPFNDKEVDAMPFLWHSIWIIIDASKYENAGLKEYKFIFENKEKEVYEEVNFELDVIDIALPEQKLMFTNWIHLDCIADLNNTTVFSQKHWKLIEENVKMAKKCGINMLLVPLFTPPLDTAIGTERKTVQLVGVEKVNGKYRFEFSKLERYINLLKKYDIRFFEFSHLFSQWGAKATPKIVVKENGKNKKMFGWHTVSSSEEYKEFINSFLSELKNFIYDKKIENSVYFHISDEPNLSQLPSYREARNIVYEHLKDFKIIDAISDIDFYNEGLIEIPVPCTQFLENFLPLNLSEKWTYYCGGEVIDLSNRFLAMPSYRNRIFPLQLFKLGIHGFLHWGYNFYYSQYSKRVINPYLTTDADCAFPAGDAFMIYPYKNTVIESIRSEVFYEGLQDMRALQLLEELTSHEESVKFMEEALECELSIRKYPKNPEAILNMREKVNKKIRELI